MGIKGKTTFELTDVNTGAVEIIEEENMITNGLQDFLTTYGMFGSNLLKSLGSSQLWTSLVSGLFLFDSRLDEDVNNTFMPAGVKMIGCGSKDVANSGIVTELGSYNSSESGVQGDGSIKLVYDFSTQQANGTISCACLTSKIGGYVSMGCASGRYYSENTLSMYLDDSYASQVGIAGAGKDKRYLLYPVYGENAIYFANPYNIKYTSAYASQHWSVTKKIQILKVRAGFTGVGLKDYKSLNNVIETYDVDIPQDILNYMGTSPQYAVTSTDGIDRNIYVIFTKADTVSLGANAFFWIMKIDQNMQATAYRFVNNIGKDMRIFYSKPSIIANNFDYYTFNGDYLWVYDNAYCLYGVKYADSTQIIETGVKGSNYGSMYNIGENLIGLYGENYDGGYFYSPTIYDAVNRTYARTNGRENLTVGIAYDSSLTPFADKKGVYLRYRDGDIKIYKDARYLATINNLAEPVIKTSSKTMKVTYTLTLG